MSDGRIRVMRVIARMNVGGPARQAAALMRGLDAERFDQRLYCGFAGSGEADYVDLCAPDLGVHRVPGFGQARPTGDGHVLMRLAGEMRRFQPHIVHTHTAKAGALGRMAAVLARVPVRVHSFHGSVLQGCYSMPRAPMVVAAERMSALVTDRLVAVAARVRDELVALGVGRPDQYAVVPPGVALGALPRRAAARLALGIPGGDAPVVAYVGRLIDRKRPDRLVDVARQVRRLVPGVRFLVCGGGEALGAVQTAAKGLGGTVRYLGWRADIETIYAAADLVLLTSDDEAMPVSLIEAGLAGLPAVATRVGSVPEVIQDGVTGLLAHRGTYGLTRHVVRLLRDEQLRRKMGRRAQALTTSRFGPDRLVSDVDDLYGALADQYGRQRAWIFAARA